MRSLPDDDLWAVPEFAEAELGDLRRTQRVVALATVLAQRPGASLPEACGDRAALKAAYRFFDNTAIAPQNLLDSHVDATLSRLAPVPLVLAVQDTTELDWTTHPATPGLGPPGHPGPSRPARAHHAGVHARAGALGPVGPTGVGPRPQRRGQARHPQAAPDCREGKSEVADER